MDGNSLPGYGTLRQKHAIAIAEGAVFLLDGVAIGGEDWFTASEGRDLVYWAGWQSRAWGWQEEAI